MSDQLEPKPHFNVPLPMWGKIVILVVVVIALLTIAGIHVMDCVNRHG